MCASNLLVLYFPLRHLSFDVTIDLELDQLAFLSMFECDELPADRSPYKTDLRKVGIGTLLAYSQRTLSLEQTWQQAQHCSRPSLRKSQILAGSKRMFIPVYGGFD